MSSTEFYLGLRRVVAMKHVIEIIKRRADGTDFSFIDENIEDPLIIALNDLFKKMDESKLVINKQQIQLAQAAKLSSLGEMANGIAHEINNPLTILNTSIQQIMIMQSSGKLSSDFLNQRLDKMLNTSDRIAKIVKGLMSFSENTAQEQFTPIYLKQLIDQVVDFTSERFKTNNIELKFSNITDEIMFECKPSQISQVILNLLHNAFDAVQGKENAWVEIGSTIEDDKLVLLITDSGNGIPPEVAAKIMQPLFSTKDPDKGTGLGLSVSLGVIKDHGGHLEYVPESKNTQFKITLPLIHTM